MDTARQRQASSCQHGPVGAETIPTRASGELPGRGPRVRTVPALARERLAVRTSLPGYEETLAVRWRGSGPGRTASHPDVENACLFLPPGTPGCLPPGYGGCLARSKSVCCRGRYLLTIRGGKSTGL